MISIDTAERQQEWDDFLASRQFRPFLQSWTMGEVYRDIGQEPIRLEARENGAIVGICLAIFVPARRGRHLAIQYGPVLNDRLEAVSRTHVLEKIMDALKDEASARSCSFIRLSPFFPQYSTPRSLIPHTLPAPMHLLAEHLWYLPLTTPDPWMAGANAEGTPPRLAEEILAGMRKTTRNLVRRAEKEGVEVEASTDPNVDVEHFIALHDLTRKRHGFTAYTNAFFRAQVRRFAARNECTLYLARHAGEIFAASIHMHAFGETSYHHGASKHTGNNLPVSYLLQWQAIRDALMRGDRVYNFWGIAPEGAKQHPFAGVTLFKTGFGGALLNLAHCMDLPLKRSYTFTRAFEIYRRWRRGFSSHA